MIDSKKGASGGVIIFFIIFIVIIMFMFGVYALIGSYTQTIINDDIQNDPSMNNDSKQFHDDLTTSYPKIYDSAFLVMFILAWIGLIIAGLNYNEHPIWLVISIIVLFCLVFIAAVIANAYEEIAATDGLTTIALNFPITSFITGHFVEVVLVIVFSLGITIYGKSKYL